LAESIAIGIAIRDAIGAAMDDIAGGIPIGTAMGAGIGVAWNRRHKARKTQTRAEDSKSNRLTWQRYAGRFSGQLFGIEDNPDSEL
jgi:hypothetical protein